MSTEVNRIRVQIDAIDTAITRLLNERAILSDHAQQERVRAGQPRIELRREADIRSRYVDALGGDGSFLADAVLRICRGKSDG
jgi:chorismate mutase